MPVFNTLYYSFMVILISFSQPIFGFKKEIEFRDQNFTLIKAITTPGGHPTRDTSLLSCSSLGYNYEYLQINGISGEACIGWELYPNCGNGSWDDPEWTNIQDAMGEIVTKGSQLSSSNAGMWNGTLLTTGFSDRDTSLFDFFLAELDVKTSTIYWIRNNDSAQVTRAPRCP